MPQDKVDVATRVVEAYNRREGPRAAGLSDRELERRSDEQGPRLA
jgi:hypothetical protein